MGPVGGGAEREHAVAIGGAAAARRASRTRETQSSVFLSSGVIEALYSGLAMKTP